MKKMCNGCKAFSDNGKPYLIERKSPAFRHGEYQFGEPDEKATKEFTGKLIAHIEKLED